MTGVSSIASIGPIRNRFPEISRTTTRCSPRGLVDAVSFAKTLSGGAAVVLERIEGCGRGVFVHAELTRCSRERRKAANVRAASTPAKHCVDSTVKEGTWRLRRATLISVMETTDFGNRDDSSGACRLDRSAVRRVLAQSEMSPTSVVVRDVGEDQSAQVCLAEHDDVVEALASN
jgi:hypothetical protein